MDHITNLPDPDPNPITKTETDLLTIRPTRPYGQTHNKPRRFGSDGMPRMALLCPVAYLEPREPEKPRLPATLHERMLLVSKAIAYIQKERWVKSKSGENLYQVISFDDLVRKLRPILIDHGILCYPDAEGFEVRQTDNLTVLLMRVRLVNVHDPSDFIAVPTFAEGIDNQDIWKKSGKLMTYAVKAALRYVLLLETGDDPDFDPVSTGPEVAPARKIKIQRIYELAEKHHGEHVAEYIEGALANLARKYSRRIPNVYAVPDEVLDEWIGILEKVKAPAVDKAPAS